MTSPDNWGDLLHPILATTVASNISGSTIGVNAIGNATGPLPPANGSSYTEAKPFTVAQIKGEMVTVELNGSKLWHNGVTDDGIKIQLMQDLLEKLMKSNCIEFTKQTDPNTMDYIYRARIFAVPNTDVQIIRTVIK
jgi:hypothetical protein